MLRPPLQPFRPNKPCFFCGSAGPISKEHAPPRKFFEGTDCDRITVPACDRHNGSKSRSDNAIKVALVQGADLLISTGVRVDIPDEVWRIIEATRPKYRQANDLVTMKPLVSDHPDDAGIELPYLDKTVELDSWAKMLTAALVWSVTGTHDSGTDWEKAGAFSPCYLPAGPEELLTPEMLAEEYGRRLDIWRDLEDGTPWRPGWQPHPRVYPMAIYRFDVKFEETEGGHAAIFRHYFYSAHPYFVLFETSAETISRMEAHLDAEAERLRASGIVPPASPLPLAARYRK